MIDLSTYKKQGFLLLKGLLPASEVEEIRTEAKQLFTLQLLEKGLVRSSELDEEEFEESLYQLFKTDQKTFVNCARQTHYLISLHRLSLNPILLDCVQNLGLSMPILAKYPTIYFNSRYLAVEEHYWRQREHQDWRYLQGSLDSVVIWLPLVDMTPELGCLQVLPRSHLQGLLDSDTSQSYGRIKPELINDSEFTTVGGRRGDALIFSAFLVHRAGENITRSIRWSCHFRYGNLAEESFSKRGFPHPYDYKPISELFTPGFPSKEELKRVFAQGTNEKIN